jgi:hypothetical protein
MPRRRYLVGGLSVVATAMLALAAIFAGSLGAAPRLAQAAAPASGAVREVSSSVQHGVSPAARDLPAQATAFKGTPDRPLLSPAQNAGPSGADGALQSTASAPLAATVGAGFAGIGVNSNTKANPCNCAPPDTNGAAGATQYVQIVNTAFGVYSKTGVLATGFPKAINTLWSSLGNVPCANNDDGDPIVQYDQAAGRWIITQFSVTNGGTVGFWQCVAVSTTSDATGTYNLYTFNYGTVQFVDYPKLGVWSDGYYITYNIFNNGQTFAGPKTCAWDRTAMINGAASATQVCFQLGTSVNSILPADLDGTLAPPAGSPNYQLSLGSNALNFFKFHVDFVNTANSTLTGPTSIPVASFSQACGGGTCIPQPNTKNQLDSLADRLMYRLAYRTFADGHESLVVTHSVKVSGNNRSQVDGVRWYEIRNPGGTPSVFQQGTFSPDSTSRWMGSVAMDKLGNIAIGYSESSSSVVPSIAISGRVPTDPAGTLEAEQVVKPGVGSQTGTLHRWGDYSAMQVDPADDCTFWYTNEYIPANGSFNWSTWVTSFKMPGC